MKALQFPLIKITLFFVLGILFGFWFTLNIYFSFLFVLFVFVISSLVFYFTKTENRNNSYFGITTFFLAFCIGFLNQEIHNNLLNKKHYINQLKNQKTEHLFEVSLKEKLKNSVANDRFVANVVGLENKDCSGKIIVNIRKDSANNHNFIIGNRLKFKALIYKNKPIKNPNQFDYGKYLENQNIYAQVYCGINDISVASKIDKNIWYFTAQFRNRIIHNLEKNNFSKKELAVISALILGQQQDISPDILQDYQLAGAVHILSVSGLHVGFILLFVGFLLKPFPNAKHCKIYKLVIVLLSLWAFGFVAGLAPSILRSVVMFSFVAVGRYLGRGVNIYNTLVVSAFLILLYQPSFLFDVGFQLSYVSLFFIIWLEPLFAKIWEPENKIIKFFWSIITVSFAAQIGAMGLSIYYFHQFPGLFFLTNLIVLPAIGFIMAYGVFIMLLAYFDFAPVFLTNILEKSVWVLNQVIGWIASLEDFVLRDISLDKSMLISLYLLIFMVIIYFKKPNFTKLSFALVSIIIFQSTILFSKNYYQKQEEFVVFNIKKNTIIAEKIGSKTTVFANDSILNLGKVNSNLNQYLVANFSKINGKKSIPNLLFFKNKKIMIINKQVVFLENENPDILIISGSPKLNLERYLTTCQPKIIVADGSNYKTYVNVWRATCQLQNITFHSTDEKGFFKI